MHVNCASLSECLPSPRFCSWTTCWVLHPARDFEGCDILRGTEEFSAKGKSEAPWYLLQFVLSGTSGETLKVRGALGQPAAAVRAGECLQRAESGTGALGITLQIKSPNSGLNQHKKTPTTSPCWGLTEKQGKHSPGVYDTKRTLSSGRRWLQRIPRWAGRCCHPGSL